MGGHAMLCVIGFAVTLTNISAAFTVAEFTSALTCVGTHHMKRRDNRRDRNQRHLGIFAHHSGGGTPFSAGRWTQGEVWQILRDRIPLASRSQGGIEHARDLHRRPSNYSQHRRIICDARCYFTD
jgi:hypothetical protein